MSPGKVAAQCAHAALGSFREASQNAPGPLAQVCNAPSKFTHSLVAGSDADIFIIWRLQGQKVQGAIFMINSAASHILIVHVISPFVTKNPDVLAF